MPPILVSNRMMELFVQERRSEGRHVSTAIHRVMKSLYPDRFGGEDDNDRLIQARFNLGNAMEEVIVQSLQREFPGQYVRPGQLELDGVYGTPDLWDVLNQATVEIKLTWASAARAEDIEDVWWWRYWAQLKAYAKMGGMSKGHLIIVFVNGNYRRDDPSGSMPTAMMWEWDFTDEELDENWAMIRANAEDPDE